MPSNAPLLGHCDVRLVLAGAQVQAWIDKMAHFVKSVDPNHMVRPAPDV